MQAESQSEPTQGKQRFPLKRGLWLLIISSLFIAALGIRFYHIDEPSGFAPMRHYLSALIARGYYFRNLESIPEWRKQVAIASMRRNPELPIMETITALAYRAIGGEKLWVPRLLSSIFWLIGGAFLYLLAKELISIEAAAFSMAFYLFLPFSIAASMSFQPDPLMIMLFLASLFAIWRYHARPSLRRLVIAAIVSGLALFVKPPICLFVIFGAFISLSIFRQGVRRTAASRNLWLFAIMSLLPTVLFFVYGMFITGYLRGLIGGRFLPQLLFSPLFWQKWLRLINHAIGYVALIGALLGLLMLRRGSLTALLIGLWIGYIVFGLVFNWHIHTHQYYHLQLIPIVALSLGSAGALISSRLGQARAGWIWRLVVWGALLVVTFISPSTKTWGLAPDFAREVSVAQEIGEAVGHSTKTILMSFYNGMPLQYYGELSGQLWPAGGALRQRELLGKQELNVEERLNKMIKAGFSEYFIVTNFGEFEAQKDLKQVLSREFPIVAKSKTYLIFDLRKRIAAGQ